MKPAAFTEVMSCCVIAGLPQAVSPQIASMVFPTFQPIRIGAATCWAVGS
ncbi:hypothetical protein [Lysobacter gummosus]